MMHHVIFDSKWGNKFPSQSLFSINDYFGIKCKWLSVKDEENKRRIKSTCKLFVKSEWASQKIDLSVYIRNIRCANIAIHLDLKS